MATEIHRHGRADLTSLPCWGYAVRSGLDAAAADELVPSSPGQQQPNNIRNGVS